MSKVVKRKWHTANEHKKAIIKEAGKLEEFCLNMKKQEVFFIFVGNVWAWFICNCNNHLLPLQVPPTATEASLCHHFKGCGPIDDVIIWRSTGVPLAGQVHALCTAHDKQYATILFSRAHSVAKALQLNKTNMEGYDVKVRTMYWSRFGAS